MRRALLASLLVLLAAPACAGADAPLFPRKAHLHPGVTPARAAAAAAGPPAPASTPGAVAAARAAAAGVRYASGVLLVTYRRGRAAHRAALARAVGGRELGWNADLRVQRLRVNPAAAARLRRSAAVARVERDPVLDSAHTSCVANPVCAVPNDPFFSRQWWLQNDAATVQPAAGGVFGADVDAPFAWRITTGSTGVLVAVVDSGVDLTHPDIGPRVVKSATLNGNAGNLTDHVGHGTAVAGVIAAIPNNGAGVAGVAFNASILNVKVESDAGQDGSLTCSSAADGITYAADAGANIVNLSFSSPAICDAERAAVDYATAKGALLIAAAGNDADSVPHYPAALPNVLAVAATDNGDRRASFSSFGASWVDLAAPGTRIWTTLPVAGSDLGAGYGYVDGTSFAAPVVSGIAALIWPSVSDANGDGRRNDDVARRLVATADPIAGTGADWEFGRVNACRAAADGAALCPSPSTAPAPAAAAVPVQAASTPAAVKAPAVTLAVARARMRSALAGLLGAQYHARRNSIEHCGGLVGAGLNCRVSWTTVRWSYWGTAAVRLSAGLWRHQLTIHRVSRSCAAHHARVDCASRTFRRISH